MGRAQQEARSTGCQSRKGQKEEKGRSRRRSWRPRQPRLLPLKGQALYPPSGQARRQGQEEEKGRRRRWRRRSEKGQEEGQKGQEEGIRQEEGQESQGRRRVNEHKRCCVR